MKKEQAARLFVASNCVAVVGMCGLALLPQARGIGIGIWSVALFGAAAGIAVLAGRSPVTWRLLRSLDASLSVSVALAAVYVASQATTAEPVEPWGFLLIALGLAVFLALAAGALSGPPRPKAPTNSVP